MLAIDVPVKAADGTVRYVLSMNPRFGVNPSLSMAPRAAAFVATILVYRLHPRVSAGMEFHLME